MSFMTAQLALFGRLEPFFRGTSPLSWHRPQGGYGGGEHWLLRLSDGRSCFIKSASDARSAAGLRTEYQVYSQIRAPFLPQLLWWDDDGEMPVLVLEDLSDTFWPPPWTPKKVEQVLAVLHDLHSLEPPVGMRAVPRDQGWEGWELVAADPAEFLELGFCSTEWLSMSLDSLRAASASVAWGPTHLVHNDVRSDNICFRAGAPILVDWSLAGLGSPVGDVAIWLPSLHAEGGPPPEDILPDAPAWAALLSGYYAARPHIAARDAAAGVRNLKLEQLKTALPWAVRALGLPPLDGAVEV